MSRIKSPHTAEPAMKRRPCWLRDLLDWAVVIGGGIIGLAIGVPIGRAIVWMWLR